MNELVDQSQLQRLLGADLLACENEVECTRQPNLPRQPLRTSGARNQPELNFRQTENRLWVIGSDAISARKRRLESDENLTRAQPAAIRATCTRLQRVLRIGLRCPPCGQQASQDSGQNRDCQREPKDGTIQADIVQAWQASRRECQQSPKRPMRQHKPKRPAQQAEQQRLH